MQDAPSTYAKPPAPWGCAGRRRAALDWPAQPLLTDSHSVTGLGCSLVAAFIKQMASLPHHNALTCCPAASLGAGQENFSSLVLQGLGRFWVGRPGHHSKMEGGG